MTVTVENVPGQCLLIGRPYSLVGSESFIVSYFMTLLTLCSCSSDTATEHAAPELRRRSCRVAICGEKIPLEEDSSTPSFLRKCAEMRVTLSPGKTFVAFPSL
jgi:hypothetical protein